MILNASTRKQQLSFCSGRRRAEPLGDRAQMSGLPMCFSGERVAQISLQRLVSGIVTLTRRWCAG